MQIIIELVCEAPYFKNIGSKQIYGISGYSQVVGDINFSDQATMIAKVSKCLVE